MVLVVSNIDAETPNQMQQPKQNPKPHDATDPTDEINTKYKLTPQTLVKLHGE